MNLYESEAKPKQRRKTPKQHSFNAYLGVSDRCGTQRVCKSSIHLLSPPSQSSAVHSLYKYRLKYGLEAGYQKNKGSCLGKRKTTYLEPMLCWWAGWMLGNSCVKSFLGCDVSALPTTVFRTCGAKLLSWSFMGGMDWPLLSWWKITHDFFGWVS